MTKIKILPHNPNLLLSLFILMATQFSILRCSNDASNAFVIKKDRVIQSEYESMATSSTSLSSNYTDTRQRGIPQPIIFKLSINGEDNEAGFGVNHEVYIPDGITIFYAPLISFGQSSLHYKTALPDIHAAKEVHFRVDMKNILNDFSKQGFTVTTTGDSIFQNNFNGLYLAGGQEPMQWLWDNKVKPKHLKFNDEDQDSIYSLTLTFKPQVNDVTSRAWQLSQDISGLPRFSSPQAPILETLYNLALEEAILDIRDDSTFMAGAKWPGVWTRDISYAIDLSLGTFFPEISKKSLIAKISKSGRIIQDTGTGGSWPVSSDRIAWARGAWQTFMATGDSLWLTQITAPIILALKEDFEWNRNRETQLLKGETSFLDWREQSYAPWMTPANIHQSSAFSSNIQFLYAMRIASVISNRGEQSQWMQRSDYFANILPEAFWNQRINGFSSYLCYTPFENFSPNRDALSEALAIQDGIISTELGRHILSSYPRTPYGTPVMSPQLPNVPKYHNKGIWPFVEAYQLLAAKKVGHTKAYKHGFEAIIRSAALNLSHKENFAYDTGSPWETEINSDRQLWSVAGYLSAIYRGLFGVEIVKEDAGFALSLKPSNPFDWNYYGLENLQLHGVNISLSLNGLGDSLQSMSVNDIDWPTTKAIPLKKGETLNIKMKLMRSLMPELDLNFKTTTLPSIPKVSILSDTLMVTDQGFRTLILNNNRVVDTLNTVENYIFPDSMHGFINVASMDSLGTVSHLSNPYYIGGSYYIQLKNETNTSTLLDEKTQYLAVSMKVNVSDTYLVRFHYSNGNGAISTGISCGLGRLIMDKKLFDELLVFPHTGDWNQLNTTAWIPVQLDEGQHNFMITNGFLPVTNMSGEVNTFSVHGMEMIGLKN